MERETVKATSKTKRGSHPKRLAAKAAAGQPKPKASSDERILARIQDHRAKADKHRAHADLLEAKLKVQGKEVHHKYPDKGDGPPQLAVRPRRPSFY